MLIKIKIPIANNPMCLYCSRLYSMYVIILLSWCYFDVIKLLLWCYFVVIMLLFCCRRLIWEDNVNYIQKHNLAADRGEHTYWLGQNEYADMVGGV